MNWIVVYGLRSLVYVWECLGISGNGWGAPFYILVLRDDAASDCQYMASLVTPICRAVVSHPL